MSGALLFVGQSHVGAIRDAARRRREADPAAPRTRTIHSREPQYAPEMVVQGEGMRLAPPLAEEVRRQIGLHAPTVASVIGGNAHNALALLRHTRPFDFRLSGEPSPPLAEDAEHIPEASVRAALAHHLAPDIAMMGALRDCAGAFVQVESVPPLADDRLIAAAADAFFVERGIATVGVAPAGLRYRMWRLAARLMREAADALGCAWLSVPAGVCDDHGFLRPELAGDATHGNGDYGEAIIRAVEAR